MSQSGGVELNDNQIIKFVEKPEIANDIFMWVNGCIYFFNKNILTENDILPNKDFGFDILPKNIEDGEKIYGFKSKGELITIDTISMLNKVIED